MSVLADECDPSVIWLRSCCWREVLAGTSIVLAVLLALQRQRHDAMPFAVPSARVAVTILAINDFHGNLRPPLGGIAIADPKDARKKVAIPAGGAEHMATLVKGLRARKKNSVFVAAGDLIGASPLLSALFHDGPTIESLSPWGLRSRRLAITSSTRERMSSCACRMAAAIRRPVVRGRVHSQAPSSAIWQPARSTGAPARRSFPLMRSRSSKGYPWHSSVLP